LKEKASASFGRLSHSGQRSTVIPSRVNSAALASAETAYTTPPTGDIAQECSVLTGKGPSTSKEPPKVSPNVIFPSNPRLSNAEIVLSLENVTRSMDFTLKNPLPSLSRNNVEICEAAIEIEVPIGVPSEEYMDPVGKRTETLSLPTHVYVLPSLVVYTILVAYTVALMFLI